MHVPDGFLSNSVNASAAAVSAGTVAFGLYRARKTLGDKQIPLLGVTAAFIFAAQMLNFPVAGGTSGHFLGAMLAAVLLGPFNACLIMSVVLTIQCLLFADGGLTALGTNIFNMGIIGGIVAYGGFWLLKSVLPKSKASLLAATAVSSWFSVVLASSCCAIELAISGTSPIWIALPAMAGTHALIGIGEAIITTVVISMVMVSRPDLIGSYAAVNPKAELQGACQ